MKLSDADILDIVRRLRSYMSTMDNIHTTLNLAQDIDDQMVVKQIKALVIDIPPITLRCAQALRGIEATRQYRDMTKKFNIPDEDEDEND